MNAPFLTRGADGYDRRGFSVADVIRMIELGIIGEDENIELLEGEIVPVAPETSRHVVIKNRLSRFIGGLLPVSVLVATDSTLYLDDRTFVEPDIYIVPDHPNAAHTSGSSVLLLIEVALTSLGKDHNPKAALYARHGIADYWVIDPATLTTRVFREPVDGAYRSVVDVVADEVIVAFRLDGLSVRMADLNPSA